MTPVASPPPAGLCLASPAALHAASVAASPAAPAAAPPAAAPPSAAPPAAVPVGRDVARRLVHLAADAVAAVRRIPSSFDADRAGAQLARASAAGCTQFDIARAGHSLADVVGCLAAAAHAARDTAFWLGVIGQRFPDPQLERLAAEARGLAALLSTSADLARRVAGAAVPAVSSPDAAPAARAPPPPHP